MSEEGFGIQEKPPTNSGKTFNEPLGRVLIQRRSECYAAWIASHPILWGWILFATLNTVADLVVHFFFFGDSFYGLTTYHLLLWTVAVVIWWASIAWAKRLSWKQWVAFAAALMVTWVGVWFGSLLAHDLVKGFSMSSGPSGRSRSNYFDSISGALPPLLCAAPGLCWVAAVLKRKRRN